jgi:hypothetical protein
MKIYFILLCNQQYSILDDGRQSVSVHFSEMEIFAGLHPFDCVYEFDVYSIDVSLDDIYYLNHFPYCLIRITDANLEGTYKSSGRHHTLSEVIQDYHKRVHLSKLDLIMED